MNDDDDMDSVVTPIVEQHTNAHTRLMPLCSQITKLMSTQEEAEALKEGMRDLRGQLLEMAAKRTGARKRGTGIASLPEIDNRSKDKHQKTPWSASKRSQNKK